MKSQSRWAIALGLSVLIGAPAFSAFAQEDGYLAEPSSGEAEGYIPAPEADAPARALGEAPEGYLPATGQGSGGYLANTKSISDEGFVAAPAGATEQINGGRLMLIAYAGFWLLAFAYVATLAGRARTARREVVELRRQIQEIDDRLEDLEQRGA